jgi:hypothetical protein
MKNLIPSHLHSVGWYTGAGPTAAAGPTSFLPFPCVSAERAAVSSSRVRFDSAAPLSRPRQIRVRCNKGVCVSPEWFSVRNYSSRKGLALFLKCAREKKKEPNLVQSPPLYSTAVRAWCFYLRLHFSSVRRSLFLFLGGTGAWSVERQYLYTTWVDGMDVCVC